jgi:hypothetical protein
MDDWLSYRLSDLILFSPQTYYRMFAQYHARIFPLQVVLVASAVALPLLVRSRWAPAGRIVPAVLAAWWTWVAIAFHLSRYSTINWAARYFALLFVAQAVLLVWYAIRETRHRAQQDNWVTWGLWLVAILAPVGSMLSGRTWNQVELVGATPDPTAIATLAFALSVARWRLVLAIVPLVWCGIGAATLWALDSREAWIPLLSSMLAIVFLARRGEATSAPLKG